MNTQRIITWGSFVLIVGLIIWGLIAAANKAEREQAGVAPVDEITSSDWVKGATSSLATLVEYSDFECPACATYFPLVEQLLLEKEGKVKFVYRHFPLQQHLAAIPAAMAAEAAGDQGKFWEMYTMIFETQSEWAGTGDAKAVFAGYAEKIGLDMAKYAVDVESEENREKVNADLKSGLKAGVNSTPTFYLNGVKISPRTYEEFKDLIDKAAQPTTNS
jgi:protein-disulfide isomerase